MPPFVYCPSLVGFPLGTKRLDWRGLNEIERYYSSEIDKCALAVSQHNRPEIILLG